MPHYCYKYVSKTSEIVYIGKTDKELSIRLSKHGKSGDNLPESAWDEIQSCDIYFIELPTAVMADVVESELIRRYMPKYNSAKKTKWEGIPFEEPKWIAYKQNGVIVSELSQLSKGNHSKTTKPENNCKITAFYQNNYETRASIDRPLYSELYPIFLRCENECNKSEQTIKAYSIGLRKLLDYLVDNNINEITSEAINNWVDFMKRSGLTVNTIVQYWDIIFRFFEWVKQNGFILETPIIRSMRPNYIPEAKRTLSPDEIFQLLNVSNIPKNGSAKINFRNYTIVSFIILTGLRSDELRELKLSDLDFTEETISFSQINKERTVPFPQLAQDIISKYLETGIRPKQANNDDYLFGTHTNRVRRNTKENQIKWSKLNTSTLGRLVHKYCQDVLGRNINPQNLRDCYAILLHDSDVDLQSVQKSLGHTSLSTTQRLFKRLNCPITE